MCRICMFNRAFFNDAYYSIGQAFNDLNDSNGGDGTGVAGLFADKSVAIRKGVKKSPDECYDDIADWYEKDGGLWFLFHCRMATSGGVNNAMCHPFTDVLLPQREGDSAVCAALIHNGVCSAYAGYSLDGKQVSDTRMLFHMSLHYTRDFRDYLDAIESASGAFAGFYDGVPYIVKSSSHSDLCLLWNKQTGGICWVSDWTEDVPDGYVIYSTKPGIWTYGDKANHVVLGKRDRSYPKYLSLDQYAKLPTHIQVGYAKRDVPETAKYLAHSYYYRVEYPSTYYTSSNSWEDDTQKYADWLRGDNRNGTH